MSELDDLVRQRRFEEIHEARRRVIEDERSINEALATGRVDDGSARRLFQRAVDAYIRELEYLLNPPDSDSENEYWHEKKIGEIPLPDGCVNHESNKTVEGLGEYLDLPEQLVVEVRERQREHYYEMGDVVTRNVGVQPSWELLRSAFRTGNAAASSLGLELELSDAEGAEWDTSYRRGDDDASA